MSEKTKITQQDINKIMSESVVEDVKLGEKTTVVSMTLPNGFVLVDSSSCVDPDNYDHELGVQICMKRIEEKLWLLEGYSLHVKLYEERKYGDNGFDTRDTVGGF